MKAVRRLLLLITLGAAVALVVMVYHRGLRYLPPVFEPDPLATETKQNTLSLSAAGAYVQSSENGITRFRAHVPEPAVMVSGDGAFAVEISNIHPKARLISEATVTEKIDGLHRLVHGQSSATVVLSWRFPDTRYYRFTAIGDSGGGRELEWILERSRQLNALFLLHLGDINYVASDFADAERALNNAKIPTFAAIGNHDFYEGWRAVYPSFARAIGPFNSTFVLGGVRFVNLDTAASIFPLAAGWRSKLLDQLEQMPPAPGVRDSVVFTHKPLRDPRDAEKSLGDQMIYEHAVSGRESDWLRQRLLDLGLKTVIAGHVHMSAEFDHDGLRTFVSGAGLAHADFIADKPIAQMLVGEVMEFKPVYYRWVLLKMPASAHCNPRGLDVLRVIGRVTQWEQANERCAEDRSRSNGG